MSGNPHCECPGPGYCNRHKINKSETLYNHCQLRRINSIDYWRAWEEGRLGATAPESPELLQRGAGDKVARAITRVSRGRVRPCGGCKRRQAALNSMLPGNKYPEITATPIEWEHTTRNLLYYIWPVASNDFWKWNLDQLKRRLPLFNGTLFCTIAVDDTTVKPNEVVDYIADDRVQYLTVKNNRKLRESAHWATALAQVETLDPLQMTFAAHAKCVRLPFRFGCVQKSDPCDTHVTAKWAEAMYATCLDYPSLVADQLSQFAMTGSFKRHGQFTTRGNHRWHYSGTFYWFRNRDVFQRNWAKVDKRFFGSESWPGLMFKPDETGCLFLEHPPDPYSTQEWNTKITPALQNWKTQHASDRNIQAPHV